MTEDLTSPLWGTGYGGKRHLVDMATLQRGPVKSAGSTACTAGRAHKTRLDYFADSDRRAWGGRTTEAELVASRPPCARCLRLLAKETA